ncbi:MAG: penicillin-binding protein, partial [Clostridia bacterium]|nr:penicillin-binding protein [Clostridia bacterium]
KVFTLAAAMEQNISLYKIYPGAAVKTFNGVRVENSGKAEYGNVNLLKATAQSVNTAFVALNQDVGPENTKAAAIQAGIPEDTPGLETNLVNTLGSAAPTPVDMARAYGVFAADGILHEPHLVREAKNHKDEVVYRADTAGTRVFDKRVSQEVTYALQQVTKSGGSGDTAGKLKRPVAGKTGTSSGPWSAWFCGYTPQMVTVVDMYQVGPNGEEEIIKPFGQYSTIYGGTYPTDIWYDYMKVATKDMPVEKFPSDKLKRIKTSAPTPRPTTPKEEPSTNITTSAPPNEDDNNGSIIESPENP